MAPAKRLEFLSDYRRVWLSDAIRPLLYIIRFTKSTHILLMILHKHLYDNKCKKTAVYTQVNGEWHI